MDTPDKAAGLADSNLADAINKDWLLESGRSSQLSADLRRCHQELEWSSGNVSVNNAYATNLYGATSGHHQYGTSKRATDHNESSWLLRHYANNRDIRQQQYQNTSKMAGDLSGQYFIDGHLYANISFADSSLLVRSSGHKAAHHHAQSSYSHSCSLIRCGHDRNNESPAATTSVCCLFAGKFRIFLACYLLLGITLAIYSRNALSLAAVGMVANNEINSELVTILSHSSLLSSNSSSAHVDKIQVSLDGSCPIHDLRQPLNNQRSQATSTPPPAANALWLSHLPPELELSRATKGQLEKAFRASIKQRIERGELVDWSPSQQGLIFAAGSVGNLLLAIPLTRLGEIYGPKWIIFSAVLGATLQAALMPIISPSHISLVILFQVIFNGLTYGADCVAYTLFAHWLTPTEMAFFVACLLVCYQLGTIISSFVTAKILTQGIAWSWCFYTPAILCGVWTLVWAIIGASEPMKSRFISKKELSYLLKHSKISQVVCDTTSEKSQGEKLWKTSANKDGNHQISWLKLAKDPNIWAIISVKFTLRWYFSVYVSLMPTFMSSVAHMSVDTIGKMSVFQCFVGLFSGILMSYLTKSVVVKRPFNISLPAFRKIFQSLVNFGLALSLLAFITFDCDIRVTFVALTVSTICINFYVAGALQLPLDLSPNHCGLITSISNTLALGQALGAPISGLILNSRPKDRTLWRIVWGIAIMLNTLSGLLFILLVDAKPREYNKYSNEHLQQTGILGKRRQVKDNNNDEN